MKAALFISICCFILVLSCKKSDPDSPVVNDQISQIPVSDSSLKCADLPAKPLPFGWTDSTIDQNKNINAFFFNPVNENQIIFRVNGDLFGYHKLFTYTIPTKEKTALGNTGSYLPQFNKKGWLVYSNAENNIFKIKTNGDSLTQITSTKITHDPKWDYTGDGIYYFQEANLNTASRLIRIDKSGQITNLIPSDLPYTAVFKNSDKIIYLKVMGSTLSLMLRDMSAQQEKLLIQGSYDPKQEQIYFDDLTLDNMDENFYWSNSKGIYKCNLATLVVEQLLKNCSNYIYDNPIISYKTDELTLTCHIIKPISDFVLFHQYKAMELNLTTKELREVRIYP